MDKIKYCKRNSSFLLIANINFSIISIANKKNAMKSSYSQHTFYFLLLPEKFRLYQLYRSSYRANSNRRSPRRSNSVSRQNAKFPRCRYIAVAFPFPRVGDRRRKVLTHVFGIATFPIRVVHVGFLSGVNSGQISVGLFP